MMNYEALFTQAPSAMVVVSTDGTILRANSAFCELLGYAADELASTPMGEHVYETDRDKAGTSLANSPSSRTHPSNMVLYTWSSTEAGPA